MFLKLLVVLVMGAFIAFLWWANKTEKRSSNDNH